MPLALLFGILLIKNNFLQIDQSFSHQTQDSVIPINGNPSFLFHKDGLNITYNSKNIYYQYDEIIKYRIDIFLADEVHFYLDEINNDSPEQHLNQIIPLILLYQLTDVYFHDLNNDYLNEIDFESFNKLLKDKATIWIVFGDKGCHWENKNSTPVDKIDNQTYNHWKKLCLYKEDGSAYSALFYNDDEYRIIKEITKKQITLIIIISVVVIIFVILSLFFIGLFRYKKEKARKSSESF